MPSSLSGDLPGRITIEHLTPEIDGDRYPAKCEAGQMFAVTADIFMDGHDLLKATLRYRPAGSEAWQEVPMTPEGNDLWAGSFPLEENGMYEYSVAAWEDVFGSWARDTRRKIDAGQDVTLEMIEGRRLVEAALAPGKRKHAALLEELAQADNSHLRYRLLEDEIAQLMEAHDPKAHRVDYGKILTLFADRERARFGAWYEFFPRSQGSDPSRSATFAECAARLPDIRAMGFDVVYLTPIHPIGEAHRKGKNNAVTAEPGDPGSPYAIRDHKAVHPELGTLKDFRKFVQATKKHGMEVALDFAIQCAPDHHYITEHPEWFVTRPDGTIKYAENPPKKYQDIVNVDFWCKDRQALWEELRSIVLFWIDQGVSIFRVDNPHTKAFAFWEWMIGTVREKHPDVIFLSEAFTRPKVMYSLAKLGFSQSYSYFTWRNTKAELTEYMTELSTSPVKDFFRPNFFANTPDILPSYLQTGGRPAFLIRAALAALLAPSYGLYSGYELCENAPIPGKEEYLDSEKYEIKPRDWNQPGHIKAFIGRLNEIRRENPALQRIDGLRFHLAWNDNILFFSKATADRLNIVFGVINLDPFHTQEAAIDMPLWEFGIDEHAPYRLDDLLQGHRWEWNGRPQFQHLDPEINPVAIFRIAR